MTSFFGVKNNVFIQSARERERQREVERRRERERELENLRRMSEDATRRETEAQMRRARDELGRKEREYKRTAELRRQKWPLWLL